MRGVVQRDTAWPAGATIVSGWSQNRGSTIVMVCGFSFHLLLVRGILNPEVMVVLHNVVHGRTSIRRRAEQAIFSAEEDYLNLDSGSRRHLSFPAFAYKHFKNRHGIKLMVRSVSLLSSKKTHT